ncbi:hypothetical protein D479_03803 [Halobacillus sp. BAB-2008]|nr:hypothetical protein D479_03803 [Halobacillus sp. BAB-2008]
MKKAIAFIAAVGIVVSVLAPLTQDEAVRTYPRPLVEDVV